MNARDETPGSLRGDHARNIARALPISDDGWARVLRRVGAIAVLWAIAAYVIAAAGLPHMDPQCYSDSPTGGRVCPLHPDPALTHLFDVRWPAVPEAVGVIVALAAMFLGAGLAIFLDTSEPWSMRGGAPTVAGMISGLLGCGVGLIVAGPGFIQPPIALGITALGALLFFLSLLSLRAFLRALRRRYARHLRRERLREHGNRTVATITDLRWQHAYQDDDPVFTMTAEFRTQYGTRSVTDELCAPRADAPVVGGTVVVIHDDDVDHPTGIDVLLHLDPNGLRDPEALDKYPPAPEGSPS